MRTWNGKLICRQTSRHAVAQTHNCADTKVRRHARACVCVCVTLGLNRSPQPAPPAPRVCASAVSAAHHQATCAGSVTTACRCQPGAVRNVICTYTMQLISTAPPEWASCNMFLFVSMLWYMFCLFHAAACSACYMFCSCACLFKNIFMLHVLVSYCMLMFHMPCYNVLFHPSMPHVLVPFMFHDAPCSMLHLLRHAACSMRHVLVPFMIHVPCYMFLDCSILHVRVVPCAMLHVLVPCSMLVLLCCC